MESLAKLAGRIAPLGWHLELLMHVDEFPDLDRQFAGFPVDIVLGHLGYLNIGRNADDPGFQALLRLDTSNPPGNEILATDYLKAVLEREGVPVRTFALDPQRSNLVARIKGNGSKRPVLYMGHTDVVTVDPKKWTFPPFSATRDGGYVYGRGALDDKPHVVAGLMLMLSLKRLNVPLDRDVIFLAEAGEEGTTRVGIDFMTSQHASEIQAEYCFAEGGNVTRAGGSVKFAGVQTTEKLVRTVELVATGPAGHGSVPLRGNAIAHLSAAVAAASNWRVPARLNDTTREFFGRLATISEGPDGARYRAVLDEGSSAAASAEEFFAANQPRYASMLRTSISPTKTCWSTGCFRSVSWISRGICEMYPPAIGRP